MLYNQVPFDLPPDHSILKTLNFISRADNSEQITDLYLPKEYDSHPLPLVLAPHPITWTAKEDYHGGLQGLSRGYHPGWYALAEKYKVGLVMPHGHHRRVENCSLASPEQISDMRQLINEIEDIGIKVDRQRIYACGLSMGGQEALVMAGIYPEIITAVVAFNPIIDLAVWQKSLATSKIEEIRAFGTDKRILIEVGADPDLAPELYDERSPIHYFDNLVSVPILLFWSEKDIIVPEQEIKHSYRLYKLVKEISKTSPIAEFNHTLSHGVTEFNRIECWQLHEWCDYDLALKWLLTITKPIN
jgi:predicted peptidase